MKMKFTTNTIDQNRQSVSFEDNDVLSYIEKPFVPKDAYFIFHFSDGCQIETNKQEIPYWILKSIYSNIRNSSEMGRYILEITIKDSERVCRKAR